VANIQGRNFNSKWQIENAAKENTTLAFDKKWQAIHRLGARNAVT
jgi:hypothetical protein